MFALQGFFLTALCVPVLCLCLAVDLCRPVGVPPAPACDWWPPIAVASRLIQQHTTGAARSGKAVRAECSSSSYRQASGTLPQQLSAGEGTSWTNYNATASSHVAAARSFSGSLACCFSVTAFNCQSAMAALRLCNTSTHHGRDEMFVDRPSFRCLGECERSFSQMRAISASFASLVIRVNSCSHRWIPCEPANSQFLY